MIEAQKNFFWLLYVRINFSSYVGSKFRLQKNILSFFTFFRKKTYKRKVVWALYMF